MWRSGSPPTAAYLLFSGSSMISGFDEK